jgi:hypothetical protein
MNRHCWLFHDWTEWWPVQIGGGGFDGARRMYRIQMRWDERKCLRCGKREQDGLHSVRISDEVIDG